MAENMTGTESSSCGVMSVLILPVSSRSIFDGFRPRKVFVSIGSRSGSIEGFVTCEALIRMRSQ